MVGSQGPRVLRATLPHVDLWNAWHAWFGNTPDGFAAMAAEVDALCIDVGRDPATLAKTAALMVQAPGGRGRAYGASQHEGDHVISGNQRIVAAQLAEFAATHITHAQLVVDPITVESIEWLGGVLADLDR